MRKLRILIIDTYGESVLDWALRCRDDGHEVKWHFNNPQTDNVGKGLIDRVDDWRAWMRWADFVLMTDNTKHLRDLDGWRKEGIKIVGPSQEAAAWELDRKLGMKILEKHGIECPAYKEFTDYDAAIKYVMKEDRAFVSKPCGVETDKSLSYVAKSPEDLVYMLQRWKKMGKLKGSFILQEKVDGIEMGVGGWFGPGGFNEGWEENFEHKALMPSNIGPNTGEMGTVMQFVKKSKLADKTLKPLAGALEKMGYLGCIDVNSIIDAKGKAWPLEFTMRLGWPAFLIQQALHKGDHAEWLLDLAEGRDAKCFDYGELAVGVVMAIPDFPYSKITRKEVTSIPLYGITDKNRDAIHPCMVMVGEAPQRVGDSIVTTPCLVTAGDYVLVATGTGKTVRHARSEVYGVLDELKKTPGNPFWRIDIGQKLKVDLPKLQALGYAKETTY